MFKKNRILLLLATAALVTACGGGGDAGNGTSLNSGGSTGPVTDTGNTGNTGNQPPASGGNDSTPGGNTGGPTDGGNTNPDTGQTDPQPTDQQLKGYLAFVANQMPYIKTDRSIYNAVSLTQFESSEGMYDFASGSKGGDETTDVPPTAVAPAAPIAAVGFRIDKFVQRATEGQEVGNQTVVGRVAFDLTEKAGSAGIGANEAAEIMRFVIDGVELTSDATGELVSVRVKEGAQMHVYGRNAASGEVRESIPVPVNAVRLMPVSNVLDHYGDTTSTVLLFDLEAAFSQAGTKLAVLENIAGYFSMNITLSTAQLVRPAQPEVDGEPALERKDLVGEPITVTGQPTVNGGGVKGNAWIRMYPQ